MEYSPKDIFKLSYKTVSAKRSPCSLMTSKLFDIAKECL